MATPRAATMLVTRIVIEHRIGVDGQDDVTAEFVDSNGEMPGIVELLGMLELTKDTAIQAAAGCDCDDDDDE